MRLTKRQLVKLIKESLQKLDHFKDYKYGLDYIKDKTAAHDDIIGHT